MDSRMRFEKKTFVPQIHFFSLNYANCLCIIRKYGFIKNFVVLYHVPFFIIFLFFQARNHAERHSIVPAIVNAKLKESNSRSSEIRLSLN